MNSQCIAVVVCLFLIQGALSLTAVENNNPNVTCPGGGSSCPSGTTCCKTHDQYYGCCPMPNATCCSDMIHCCPNGYSCDVKDGTCNKKDSPTMKAVEKIPSKPIAKTVDVGAMCPGGGSSCPSGTTCCKTHDQYYACCPLPNATCCSDMIHCCPNGYTCDLKDGTCNKKDAPKMKAFEKFPSKPIVSNNNPDVTCPGGGSSCPSGTTCCKTHDQYYGCCPMPNATCCSDMIHCCPNGYTCDVKDGTCNKKGMPSFSFMVKSASKKIQPVPKVSSVEIVTCPDGKAQCPDGNTCCAFISGGFACCPFSNAVCCSDKEHCCPESYTCDSTAGLCNRKGLTAFKFLALIKK